MRHDPQAYKEAHEPLQEYQVAPEDLLYVRALDFDSNEDLFAT